MDGDLKVPNRTVRAVRTVKTAGTVARERTCGFFNSQATKKDSIDSMRTPNSQPQLLTTYNKVF